MSDGCGDTFFATVVEGHHTAVAERQLYFALTLLAGDFTCHRAVYLVGEPVLAGHGLQLEHALEILGELISGYAGFSGYSG